MYYQCSENKDAYQLRGYREADLRLCFRICRKPVFSRRGSYILDTIILDLIGVVYFSDAEMVGPYESLERREYGKADLAPATTTLQHADSEVGRLVA